MADLFHALERPARGRGYVDERLVRALFARKDGDGNDLTIDQVHSLLLEAGAPEQDMTPDELTAVPHTVPDEFRFTEEAWMERLAYRKQKMGAIRFSNFLKKTEKQLFEMTGACTSGLVAFHEGSIQGPNGSGPRVKMQGVVGLLVRSWASDYEADGSDAKWAQAQQLRAKGKLGEAMDLEHSVIIAQQMCVSIAGHGWVKEPNIDEAIRWQEKIIEQLSDGVDRPELVDEEGMSRLERAIQNRDEMQDGTFKF